MPGRIDAIGDLPFRCRPAAELLGLTHELGTIDVEYTGFGWTRVDRVWLDDGAAVVAVDDALVLAVHAADDGEALPDDVDLEFVLEPADGGGSVIVRASAFLARWLPRLPPARALVLAMCNPHHVLLRPPPAAGATPLYHGLGDVDSWLDPTDDGERLRLSAAGWHRSSAEA